MLLKAQNIEKTYRISDKKFLKVLKGIDLEISEGEFVALVGHSGAGKSTLLHILASIDVADGGNIVLRHNGKVYDYSKMGHNEFSLLRNKYIGFVFQFHHLLPEFTALENVMVPMLIAGNSYKSSLKKAKEMLQRVGLEEQLEQKPSELSGGEQQRVAIARALINDPVIVFADEPTGNLDKESADSVLNLIKDLQKDLNIAFLIATHSQWVSSIAERVLKIFDGKIIED